LQDCRRGLSFNVQEFLWKTLSTDAKLIWGIADDVLRDVYVRGKYRDM
jgi:hypothetical protein